MSTKNICESTKGTSDQNMNDQFESKIINLCVGKLRNSRAHIDGMACVSCLDLDHFTQLQLKRQLVSPSFNQRFPRYYEQELTRNYPTSDGSTTDARPFFQVTLKVVLGNLLIK